MLKNNVKNKIMQCYSVQDKDIKNNSIQNRGIQNKKGISLIALVITIIVIIILATIVMVSGNGQVDKTTFAKFEQEFSDFDTIVRLAVVSNKTNHAVKGNVVSDKQAIYEVASNKKIDDEEDIIIAGKVANLNLDIGPEKLEGNEYYEIIDKNTIKDYKKQKNFYSSEEKLYVTDTGEVFTLPGFPLKQDEEQRYYINENKYYTGEKGIETVTFTIQKGSGYEYLSSEQKELWNQCLGSYTVPKGTTWQDFIDSEEYNPTRITHIEDYTDETGKPKDIEMKIFAKSYSYVTICYPEYYGNYVSFSNDWTCLGYMISLTDIIEDGRIYEISVGK